MRVLVYGAGVTGTMLAVTLHEAGHHVDLLARGRRLDDLRANGVRLAKNDDPAVRRVDLPVVDRPGAAYDLIAVLVRTDQVDAVLGPLADVGGDVVFMVNWAAGPEPLGAVIGRERVLLGFPPFGGTMDGGVVRHRSLGRAARLIPMPIGEADGRTTPRLARIVREFRAAGMPYRAQPRMDAWLRTHAAFEVPLGLAVHEAGGPEALAADPAAVRAMLRRMRAGLPGKPVPGAFAALRTLPEAVLVPVFRRFLRSPVAVHSGLSNVAPSAKGEYVRLAEQLSRGHEPAA